MDARTTGWMAAVVMAVAAMLATPAPAAGGGVRPLQPRGVRLLEEASRRSSTVRDLVDELKRSDVVVYVDLDANEAGGLEGSLRFGGASAAARYVRVWLQPRRCDEAVMSTLAHELQHAVEVARAADVTSTERLQAMYTAAGKSNNPGHYETAAAQEAGARVRRELETNR